MTFSPIQRLLRRVPAFRWCVYQNASQVRKRSLASRWEYTRTIFSIVGETTITWAGVERMLDELIAHYQHHYTDLSAEHPRSLSSKCEYLKVRMQRDQRFTPETRLFLRHTRIEATRLGNERHEIIHGMLMRTGTVIWRTQRVAYNKATAHLVHREFHNDDILRIYREISEFMRYLAPRVWLLIGRDRSKYPRDKVEQALRELNIR